MHAAQVYLSTVSAGCDQAAQQYGVGLEIAEFCTAAHLDSPSPSVTEAIRQHREAANRFVFHAPFNELCPAAIDPLAVELARHRYRQAFDAAAQWNCKKIVIHTGFIPMVYFSEWFIEKSVLFWRELMQEVPDGLTVCLENVMEPSPEIPVEIVRQVDHPRMRLCLDVGHANSEASHTDVLQWADTCAPYLSHLHLHNNKGAWDLHDHLWCGTIPMKEVLTRLETLPNLTYTLETLQAEENVLWLLKEGFLTL